VTDWQTPDTAPKDGSRFLWVLQRGRLGALYRKEF